MKKSIGVTGFLSMAAALSLCGSAWAQQDAAAPAQPDAAAPSKHASAAKGTPSASLKTAKEKQSYAIGMNLG